MIAASPAQRALPDSDPPALSEVEGSLSDSDLLAILRKEENAASNYQWSALSQTREDALNYYDREPYGDEQDGHGTFQDGATWTIAGKSGFYAPMLPTQNGDIFVIGTANTDGQEHVRIFDENTFGFEDLRAD